MKYFSIKNVISVKELVHIGGLTITERWELILVININVNLG